MSWMERLFGGAKARTSASQAKERLQLVICHERGDASREAFMTALQKDLMEVLHRHLAREHIEAKVAFEHLGATEMLRIDVVLPEGNTAGAPTCPAPAVTSRAAAPATAPKAHPDARPTRKRRRGR